MSVQHSHTAVAEEPLTLAAAHEHLYQGALRPGPIATIGLELEAHLVDLRAPASRVGWDRITALRAGLPALPGGSDVTTEPGGQLELSAPPLPLSAAIAAMRRDQATLRPALTDAGLGVASIGTDPARRSVRVTPEPRYAAMETHFGAIGQLRAGKAMMCSTAALQINLDAGPAAGVQCHLDELWIGRADQSWRTHDGARRTGDPGDLNIAGGGAAEGVREICPAGRRDL